MREIQIHILDQCYDEKPVKKEIVKISQNITFETKQLDIEKFAKEVGEKGKPFTPALFNGNRKKECFAQQEVYALDFDTGFTFVKFMERSKQYGVIPVFVYKTFSHSDQHERFRAVYISDCITTDRNAAAILIKVLLAIFPEADKNCSDVSRLFLGGKGILYFNPEAEINIRDMVLNLQTQLRKKDKKNYGRNITKLGNQLGIEVKKNLLCVHRLSELGKKEDFGADLHYIIMGDAQDSSKCYLIDSQQKHHTSIRSKENIGVLRNKSCRDITKICPLFDDFYKKDLPHEYKFLLATNLIYVKGGKTFFFDGLIDHYEKWEVDWKYIKEFNYHPQGCQNAGCPYWDKCRCRTLYEKLSSRVVRVSPEEPYISLQQAEGLLHQLISDALKKTDNGIHLVAAQTALGKTTAYCRIAENWQETKPLMIVVPTIKLQGQVYDDLKYTVKDLLVTPNVAKLLDFLNLDELRTEVNNLYDKGLGHRVKRTIKEYVNKYKDVLTQYQLSCVEDYLGFKKKLDGKKPVITTHAMLLSLPETVLDKYEILVDEDILMTIFKNTGSMTFSDLEQLLDLGILRGNDTKKIQQMMDMENGTVGKTGLSGIGTALLDWIYDEDIPICSSIADFMESDTFYVDRKEEIIRYFRARKLPDVKMTIVSATINEKLYRDFCKRRYIDVKKVPYVKYKGQLKQYTAYSMSRSCIIEMDKNRVMQTVYTVTGKKDINWISFKMMGERKDLYFGKTEGFNDYKGKNLAVIGTPHNLPLIYLLIGKYLGYNTQDALTNRNVQHNGYQFRITTYGGEEMRKLQFYFLESELEQAIGRARLLRFDCTVYLFSNFPCKQAEIIQDSYMEDFRQELS